MPVNRHYVRGLAESIVQSINKSPLKEREKAVSPRLAGELNKVIDLAKEVAPEQDARMWPQPIQIVDADFGMMQTLTSHAEVEAAARQILVLLPQELLKPQRG